MEPLAVTAIHEAGHVIAVKLRNGTVRSVSLDPGLTTYVLPRHREQTYRNGQLIDNPVYGEVGEPDAFVAFAGNWAEARAEWLSAPRADRQSFAPLVASALIRNTGDRWRYEAVELPDDHIERWHVELLHNWPAIRAEAQVLLTVHREEIHWRRVRTELAREKKFKTIRAGVPNVSPRLSAIVRAVGQFIHQRTIPQESGGSSPIAWLAWTNAS